MAKIPKNTKSIQENTLKSEKDELLRKHKITMTKLKNRAAKMKAELADIGPKSLQADNLLNNKNVLLGIIAEKLGKRQQSLATLRQKNPVGKVIGMGSRNASVPDLKVNRGIFLTES